MVHGRNNSARAASVRLVLLRALVWLCALLLLALLWPLILLQGVWVRSRTERLPEAEGARHGLLQGSGSRDLSLLIIGDSAAAGVGVTSQSQALSGQLLKAINQQQDYRQLRWRLQAETGRTSSDLVCMLESGAGLDADERSFDVAVVSIGVNDVTRFSSMSHWRQNLARIAELLKTDFSVGQIVYSGMPPMHRFPALPQPLRWCLGLRAKQLDRAMQDFCANQANMGCCYLPLPYPEEAGLIAADGFHPGAGAYRLWAELLAADIVAAFRIRDDRLGGDNSE